MSPTSASCCSAGSAGQPEDYDAWAQALHDDEVAFIPPSKWEGETVGRFAFLHPDTSHGPGPRDPRPGPSEPLDGDLLVAASRPAASSTTTACCASGAAAPTTSPREFGTPVLVVAEPALRARAREYGDELDARWPRSRVVFASKAFPCTAVQRVMVEEGLGLDVAGGGEILTALKAGVDPGADRAARQRQDRRGDRARGRARRRLVVVDNSDDVDRLEATVPDGRTPGRAGAHHPRGHGGHARARPHRARGFEVRPGTGRRRRS